MLVETHFKKEVFADRWNEKGTRRRERNDEHQKSEREKRGRARAYEILPTIV